MTTEDILLDITDGVARITLNRPDAGNSVTREQRELLGTWLTRANEDPSIRCVVLGRPVASSAPAPTSAAWPRNRLRPTVGRRARPSASSATPGA